MLTILKAVEKELPKMLQDDARWKSMYVDYHQPYVERLWCEWSDFRVYLHRIHTCDVGEALFHPHPWPSAMKVLDGIYEMGVGYSVDETIPPLATTLLLGKGSEYEMVDQRGWHYVRPLNTPTISLMITGKPWEQSSSKQIRKFNPLTQKQKDYILTFFRKQYN